MCDSDSIDSRCLNPQTASCCRPLVIGANTTPNHYGQHYESYSPFCPVCNIGPSALGTLPLPLHEIDHHAKGEMEKCPRCAINAVLIYLDRYLSDEGEGGGLFPKIGM